MGQEKRNGEIKNIQIFLVGKPEKNMQIFEDLGLDEMLKTM